MKLGMDVFCSSPASTAKSSGNIQDNHRHHTSGLLKDQRRSKTNIHQTPQKGLERGNNSSSSSSLTPRLIRMLSTPCSSSSEIALTVKPLNKLEYKQLQKQQQQRGYRKSSSTRWYGADDDGGMVSDKYLRRKSNSTYAGDVIAPARAEDISAKHLLLEERRTFDQGSNSVTSKDSTTALVGRRSSSSRRPHSPLTMVSRSSTSPKLKPSSSSTSSANDSSIDKVVVLWVSLHCKGCEAKVRKHISKMEGVNSFSTDLVTKSVTIISSMNPHEVLASVSRVKYAQFWPATSSS